MLLHNLYINMTIAHILLYSKSLYDLQEPIQHFDCTTRCTTSKWGLRARVRAGKYGGGVQPDFPNSRFSRFRENHVSESGKSGKYWPKNVILRGKSTRFSQYPIFPTPDFTDFRMYNWENRENFNKVTLRYISSNNCTT